MSIQDLPQQAAIVEDPPSSEKPRPAVRPQGLRASSLTVEG
jgi:hypothetical protein